MQPVLNGMVYIVDDDASVRRLLETLLTDAGYVAATARSGTA